MARSFPTFIPILTSYAARVSGRSPAELLSSPGALARAVADTQRVAGQDGVLCLYAPELLVDACVTLGNGSPEFCPAEDVPRCKPLSLVLEAAHALHSQLPGNVFTFACFPGPGFVLSALRSKFGNDSPELADCDYVSDAFTFTARAALETGIQGIAVVEKVTPEAPGLESAYRSTRKLADFYSAAFLIFLEQSESVPSAPSFADFSFQVPTQFRARELVVGIPAPWIDAAPPATTAGDVPGTVSVQELQSLRALNLNHV